MTDFPWRKSVMASGAPSLTPPVSTGPRSWCGRPRPRHYTAPPILDGDSPGLGQLPKEFRRTAVRFCPLACINYCALKGKRRR